MPRHAAVLLALVAVASLVAAEPPQPPIARTPTPRSNPAEAAALTKVLRDLAERQIPDPLSKSSQNWGRQKAYTRINRYREGLRIWSEPVQELRNEGVWRRTTVRLPEPEKLALAVTELTHPEPGKIHATVAMVAERVDLRFEQQVWRNGLRLYGGETRAHCKGGLVLKAEVVTRSEIKKGSFLPVFSMKLRLTDADLYYENLVVDHTAGVDGDLAKAIGDALIDLVKAVKPDIEKDLRARAETAVIKAVGNREFQLALEKLLPGK